jgi:hypothetical protein
MPGITGSCWRKRGRKRGLFLGRAILEAANPGAWSILSYVWPKFPLLPEWPLSETME